MKKRIPCLSIQGFLNERWQTLFRAYDQESAVKYLARLKVPGRIIKGYKNLWVTDEHPSETAEAYFGGAQ